MTLYHDHIMDHYRHPRNRGCNGHASNCESHMHNPSCGDKIQIRAHVKGGIVEDMCFEGIGCALSTAAASLLIETVKGQTVSHVMDYTDDTMVALLAIEITPARMKCATLPLHAVKEALQTQMS